MSARPDLTTAQRRVLALVEAHLIATGVPPTLRELARDCGYGSTNSVTEHLNALERKGYVSRPRPTRARAISVLGGDVSRETTLPDFLVTEKGLVLQLVEL